MAEMNSTQLAAERLKQALEAHLRQAGIAAAVSFEPVPGTTLHRFMVIADAFANMMHSERQQLVWRIARETLPVDEQLHAISAILTFATSETSAA